MPMLALMYCSPLLYLMFANVITSIDWASILLMLSIGVTGLTNPEEFRISTVLYSCMFVTMFLAYTKFITNSGLTAQNIKKLCVNIIYAYAIIQIIQQIGVLTDSYVLNGSYNIGIGNLLKVNDFTAEASQTGRVITAIAYGFIKSEEIILGVDKISLKYLWKNYKKLCLAFLYISFGTASVACAFGCFVLMLYFIERKHIIQGVLTISIAFVLFLYMETELSIRIRTFLMAVWEFDARSLFLIDPSSAARVGPYMLYAEEFDISNYNVWLGYGCDYGGIHAYSIMSDVDVEKNMGVGGIINSLYDYGLIFLFAFLFFVIRVVGVKGYELFLFLIIFSTSAFNMHTLWIFFIIVYTIRYLKEESNKTLQLC